MVEPLRLFLAMSEFPTWFVPSWFLHLTCCPRLLLSNFPAWSLLSRRLLKPGHSKDFSATRKLFTAPLGNIFLEVMFELHAENLIQSF